ncbi:MAG: hypothetical protein U0802_15685 [Candidatus Binatia bacterium]
MAQLPAGLRPHRPAPHAEQFRAYTQSWRRAAEDPDGGTFPGLAVRRRAASHSVLPHLRRQGRRRSRRRRLRPGARALLRAYFTDNRDITDAATLRAIWAEAACRPTRPRRRRRPGAPARGRRPAQSGRRAGITGVPAVGVAGSDTAITGAQPLETYRRWMRRLLDAT